MINNIIGLDKIYSFFTIGLTREKIYDKFRRFVENGYE